MNHDANEKFGSFFLPTWRQKPRWADSTGPQHRAPRLLYAASGRSRSSMDFHEIAVMTSLPVDKVKSVCKGMKDDASAIENALNSYLDNKSGPFKEAADGPGGAFSEITKQRRPKKVNIARLRPCQAAPPLPAMPRSLLFPPFILSL